MSDGEKRLSGPDLTVGVDANALPTEGAVLVGHAYGEAVVLARGRSGVFATGATCTHYGGPLGEGLVVGDTIRCPWHHACFSLRSGEPMRGPARKPIACFEVEERGGKLVVLGKTSPETSTVASPTAPDSIVIVGAGGAGSVAAETLRSEGYGGSVTLVGLDVSPPYDRPNLSKDYLTGNAPEEWLPLRPPEFYAEQRIALRLGARVDRIDVESKTIALSEGDPIAYGALVLATGADPVRLPLPGAGLPHVHTLRSLADSRAIVAESLTAKRAVVVGTGFIGLEAAASLRARSIEVTIVAPDRVPLAGVLSEGLGRAIQSLHEEHGVSFRLGARPASITEDAVTLDDGTRVPADLVVMGVGVRPTTKLAEDAGIAVQNGIQVNEFLETSIPGIFACGDVARWPDARSGQRIRVEHWVVAERQGRTAALNVLGRRQRFEAVPFFWSAHYDVTISYVGHAESWDRVDVVGSIEARDCAVAFRRGGKTLAVATIGRDHVSLEVEAAMERGDDVALLRLVPAVG